MRCSNKTHLGGIKFVAQFRALLNLSIKLISQFLKLLNTRNQKGVSGIIITGSHKRSHPTT